MSIDAIVLDMDGLMLDTEPLARAAWQRAAADLGFELSNERYLQLLGRRDDECERELTRWFGTSFPLDSFRERCRAAWESLAEQGIATKPGLLELLDWADDRQLPIAVATSSYAPVVARKLAISGVAQRIRSVVSGGDVRASKPAPDIYLEAARRLGAPPVACVGVEDSDAGIAAIHAAGMRPVMVPDLKPPSSDSLALAWRICPSLHDVRHVLNGLWWREALLRTPLQTPRLVLRPFDGSEVADALAYRDDPEFARYLPRLPQPFTEDDAQAFVARNVVVPWDRSPVFAVVLDGTVIGTVNIEIETDHARAMLGYAIGRRWWGRGLAA